MKFSYRFPAVRGLQADTPFYVVMGPFGFLGKLFITDHEAILPEYRAQRRLNEKRIPELKKYILDNRKTYVFSALSASINGSFSFIEHAENDIGILEIDMSSTFLINDGQHRKAAIEEAILDDPSLANETISIVFFEDQGLVRSQQMFTDLNKHAVITSKSLNTLYDSKNELAVLTKELVNKIEFFSLYTDKENDTLGKYSSKLFTLNNFFNANSKIVQGLKLNNDIIKFIHAYWDFISNNITEWKELQNKEITKKSLREDYIITQGVVLLALGKLANYIYKNNITNYKKNLAKISSINWLRNNPIWEGRTLREGKIARSDKSINLTYIKIKSLLGFKLDEIEIKQNENVEVR